MASEPMAIGRHHALLREFRKAFRTGPPASRLAIEGPRLLGEALRSGARVEAVLFSRRGLEQYGARLMPQLSKHTSVSVSEDAVFDAAMDAEHPQGVAALLAWPTPELESALGDQPLLLAIAGLQDPGNLGTLVRAAHAFGATGVAVLDNSVSPFNPKAVRASAGSLFHLPVIAKVGTQDLLSACRRRGIQLVASVARGGEPPEAAGLDRPSCLLVGQEAAGLSRELVRAADRAVTVPIAADVDSLNAAVAGSILLYEAARCRSRATHVPV